MTGGQEHLATRRVSTGRTLALGLVTGLLGILGNVVASFVTQWTGSVSWLAVPVAAVLVAVITAFATAHVEDSFDDGGSARPYARRGRSIPATLVTVVLVLGLGGFAATLGIQYAVGYISGDEPGTDRLVQPVSHDVGGLSMAVTKFEETRHFTRLTVSVNNGVGKSVSLPLFGYCQVVGGDGTSLEADSFKSDWSDSVAPGVRQSGTITFPGHLPDGVRRAGLIFTQLFGPGSLDVQSIQVPELHLRPRT